MTHWFTFEYCRKCLVSIGLLLGFGFQVALAEQAQIASKESHKPLVDYSNVSQFGGPASVGGQVKSDAGAKHNPFRFEGLAKSLQPYFDFKTRLNKQHGFSFGGDYNMLYQGASESQGEDHAAGGVLRLYGTWQLTGGDTPNSGSLVFKLENRHRLGTDIAPQQLASEIGYAGLTAITYSDVGTVLTNLYWSQSFNNDRVSFVAGIVDTTDYIDVYGLANPWTDFGNLAFSTDPSIPVPNQGGGVAIEGMLSDHLYLLGGLADTNGDPGNPEDSWSSFFDDGEYFKHLEFGWVGSTKDEFKDNIHLTLWQSDQRLEAGVPEGKGVAFSINKVVNKRWLPFVRGGYSDGGGAFLDRSLSLGIGYFPDKRSDTLGIGINWGRPSEDLYGPDADEQITADLFYRFQVFQHLTITPEIQVLKNPVLSPEKSTAWVAGLRARLAF